MSHPRLTDLNAIGASLTVNHLASVPVFARPEDPAVEVLAWLEANDFDLTPVEAGPPTGVVTRVALRGAALDDPATAVTSDLSEDCLVEPSLSLVRALDLLAGHDTLLVVEDGQPTGVVTRSDLERPAVTLYALGLTLTIERGLRRLISTLTHRPIRPAACSPTEPMATFGEVMREAREQSALHEALRLSKSAFKKRFGSLPKVRNHLAHGRSVLDASESPGHAIERLKRFRELADDVWREVQQPSHIWQVYGETRIAEPGLGPEAEGRLGDGDVSHVITAWNPFEQVLDDAENGRRNDHLEQLLSHRGARPAPVDGVSVEGPWAESSFLAQGLSRQVALRIGEIFGQRAIFEIAQHELRVIDVSGEVRASRAYPDPKPRSYDLADDEER